MKLEELLRDIKPVRTIGNTDIDITGVHIDSRKIKAGFLFIAVRGTQTDGHNYIDKALAQGAAAVLCETLPDGTPADNVCYIQVADSESAVGHVATVFYGIPLRSYRSSG